VAFNVKKLHFTFSIFQCIYYIQWGNRKKVDAFDQGMKRQASDLDKRKNKFSKHDSFTNYSLMCNSSINHSLINDSFTHDDSSSGSSVIEETSFGQTSFGQTSFGEPSRKHF
jgi:hypothetical protein